MGLLFAESECLPVGQENDHQSQSQLGRGQGGKVAGPQVEDLREGLIDDSSPDLESAAHGRAGCHAIPCRDQQWQDPACSDACQAGAALEAQDGFGLGFDSNLT